MFAVTRLSDFDRLIVQTLNNQGNKMAEIDDRLTKLEASTDAAFTRVSADLDDLKAKLASAGQLSPETAAHIDAMIAKADAFDVKNPPAPVPAPAP